MALGAMSQQQQQPLPRGHHTLGRKCKGAQWDIKNAVQEPLG